jgi:flagellar hook-basal body protein
MSQSMNISAGALQAFEKGRSNLASNITGQKVVASKSSYTAYMAQAIGGQTQGITVVTQNRIGAQGTVSASSTQSHMAISGQGFFVVASDNTAQAGQGTSTSSYFYSRRGDFSITESDQKLRSVSGYKLQGWKLDSKGGLPSDQSTFAGLSDISFANLASQATPTTKVSPVMNLSSTTAALKGPGTTVDLALYKGTSTTSSTGIIIPANTSNCTLNLGDTFTLTIPGIDTPVKYEFGGIALSKAIGATGTTMYGASDPFSSFKQAPVNTGSDNTQLAAGSGLNITVGGNNYTYQFTSASGQAANKQFNSLDSLKEAINLTPGLLATIDNNRLYVSSKDANNGISFRDASGGNLTTVLGLYDVPANAPQTTGINRFATLTDLQKKIATVSGVNYTAKINAAGGLDFSAADATNSLTVKGFNNHQRVITSALQGYNYVGLGHNGGWATTNVVTINSNNHGLTAGDYVTISNAPASAQLANGTYQVLTHSPDSFALGTTANIAGGAIGNQLVPAGTADFTWQKVDGKPLPVVIGAGGTRCNTTLNSGTAIFTNLVAYLPDLQHFVANDIVHITGSAAINDGYYRVTAAGAGNSLTVAIVNSAVPGVGQDLKAAANNAVAETANLSITKVTAAVGALDPFPIQLAAASSVVTLNTHNANYQIGDTIMFNMPADTVFQQITIKADTPYTVTNVTPGANGNVAVQFDTSIATPGSVANNNGYIGLIGTLDVGNNAGNVGRTFLGADAYVMNESALFRTLGITNTVILEASPLQPTYAANDPTKNFSSGAVKPSASPQTMTIYDTQGSPHNVQMAFGKLTSNTWTVEIYDNVVNDLANSQVLLASGKVTFGQDGSFQSSTLPAQITPAWTNGSGVSNVTINWGTQGAFDGLTQNAGPTNLVSMDQDGKSVGSFIGYDVGNDGIVTVKFNNGDTRDVYKIPLALAPNADGMEAISDGLYVATNESGTLFLKQMGVGGAGTVQASALEDSTEDEASDMVQFIGTTQQSSMNSAILGRGEEAWRSLIQVASK